MTVLLLSAAAMCATTTFIHCYFGGRYIAAPLLAARDLADVPKYTQYFCWHLVSAMLAVMTLAFLWAAFDPAARAAAVMAELLAVSYTLWGVGLIVWKRQSFRQMPQWALFGAIALAGGAGLAA